ncbi:hypothetical protein Rhopal_003522-T1 [Rhodotorula paludigena]|uniref:DNA replication factor Cdt1 C-terminal domain-containing protein n=1 Tax=Rhodotorula paludigena TaxID=86838 RepID=A0AAV5GD96_9BASI|nr:hypothetical protein Rhopal_003522-T1 [Rhodotorula paludigena]
MPPAAQTRRTRTAARRMMDEDEPALARAGGADEVGRERGDEAARGLASGSSDVQKGGKRATTSTSSRPPPTPPPSSSRRRTLSKTSQHSPSSSPKLLVKLSGRVYRPPSPGDPRTKREFEADLLLQDPSETVEDLERARREKRRRDVEREMARARAEEAGGSKARLRALVADDDEQDEDDGLDVLPSPSKRRKARVSTPEAAELPAKPALGAPFDRPVTPPPPPPAAFPTSAALASPSSPALGLPFAPSPRRGSTAPPLSPPLASLLALHSAVERALILHLSTSGSSLASTISDTRPSSSSSSAFSSTDYPATEATVRMPNLIDLPTLSRLLESTGKRFDESALRRLVWAWQGASPSSTSLPAADEVGGLGFVVSRARCAAPGGRVAATYGLGIAVAVRANPQLPKLELVGSPAAARTPPKSPGSVGMGRDGMSIVALWTQGKEERRREVERRLRAWDKSEKRARVKREDEMDDDLDLSFAASATSSDSIPLAALPLLPPAVAAIASTSTPSPTTPPSTPSRPAAGPGAGAMPVVSPRDFVDSLLKGKPAKGKGGSASDRDRARRERIEAKQAAQRASAYQSSLTSLSSGDSSPSKRSLKQHKLGGPSDDLDSAPTPQDLVRHNAMLSRLGSVADVVAMRCQGRPTRLEDVCQAVANSPLLAIGFDEATQSLSFLASRFPEFCYLKQVGQDEWVYLRGAQKPVDVKEEVRIELERVAAAREGATTV